MNRYAAIDAQGVVINIIVYDGVSPTGYNPAPVFIGDQAINAGDRYVNKTFITRPRDGHDYVFIDGDWVITAAGQAAKDAEDLSRAENQQQALITRAKESVSLLQLKLLAGRKLSEEELSRLNAVLDFIDVMTAIDPKNPPDEWPSFPEGV